MQLVKKRNRTRNGHCKLKINERKGKVLAINLKFIY